MFPENLSSPGVEEVRSDPDEGQCYCPVLRTERVEEERMKPERRRVECVLCLESV